jgi:hypothetical protein
LGEGLNGKKWSVDKWSEMKLGEGLNGKKWSVDKWNEVKCSWVKV